MNTNAKTYRGFPITMAVAAVALLAVTSLARADDECSKYAQLAAKQIQTNQSKNCGLKGEAWNPQPKTEMIKWCQGVTPDEWRKAISDREKQLQSCG